MIKVSQVQAFLDYVNDLREKEGAKMKDWEDYFHPLYIRASSLDDKGEPAGLWLAIDQVNGSQKSIYCFIRVSHGFTKNLGVLTAGDIHKPAGYRIPAKTARGNIFNPESFKCAGVHSIAYLR